jgi:predicted metal-dependent hydrolase
LPGRVTRGECPLMNRALRNRLANLMLEAFDNVTRREALLRLALFCELCGDRGQPRIAAAAFDSAWAARYPEMAAHGHAPGAATALEGLIEVRAGSEVPGDGRAVGSQGAVTSWYEAHPDMLPFLASVRERVRIYADVVRRVGAERNVFERLDPLRRGVAEAATCFNAGLFFEAHEHLEGYWRDLAPTPTKRFVQGLIQISVGFHHAMRGSYQGAVNQLGKGLSKLSDAPEGALGLDCDLFAREVEATRKQMLSRGRQGMRKATLHECPQMRFRC